MKPNLKPNQPNLPGNFTKHADGAEQRHLRAKSFIRKLFVSIISVKVDKRENEMKIEC